MNLLKFSLAFYNDHFKYADKLKESYNEHLYTHHLDSTVVSVLPHLLSVCLRFSLNHFKINLGVSSAIPKVVNYYETVLRTQSLKYRTHAVNTYGVNN